MEDMKRLELFDDNHHSHRRGNLKSYIRVISPLSENV
jgi:hypothetical protein